jgi:hypothetical protein
MIDRASRQPFNRQASNNRMMEIPARAGIFHSDQCH